MATVRGFTVRIKMISSRADFPELCQSCNTLMEPFFQAFAKIKSSSRLCRILGVRARGRDAY